jgi:hypothetical protein
MKRIFILFAIVLFAVGASFADEAVLIDFTKLTADIHVNLGVANEDTAPNQNRHTVMDYSINAGANYTAEQRALMRTSLAIQNWEVQLASSSRTASNIQNSYTTEADSKQYGKVMGVRIHFPLEPYNSWARVKPPFEIPASEPRATVGDDGTIQPETNPSEDGTKYRFEGGYGVVLNVGTIKSLNVQVYGLNFPHSLSTIIIDPQGKEQILHMGNLNFDGWGSLTWNNPTYVQDVRNREIRVYPLYPTSTPFVKFGGFLIQRDAANTGDDCIAYFRNVRIVYDKAVIESDKDIADEEVWKIIETRENAKRNIEMSRFGAKQVLRYLEDQKRAVELNFDDPNRPAEE